MEETLYVNLAALCLFAVLYSLVAGRLEKTPVNGPVIYLIFGLVAGPMVLGILDFQMGGEGIRILAELTLALVLFADAANTNFAVLRTSFRIPGRMLLIGLPLTILLGVLFGRLIFPELPLIEIAILATLLAPTDAALGKAVVSNPAVPAPVREGLNVESGLNDGICVPILLTFLALATSGGGGGGGTLAARLMAEQIGIGLAVGVGLSCLVAFGLQRSAAREWLTEPWVGISTGALAFACFAIAQELGGSGFIACFTGGLAFGAMAGDHKHALLDRAESTGESFSLITWVIFGAIFVLHFPEAMDWRILLYAALSLTVIRMLPIYLSLLGLGVSSQAKLFLGWFGPRGLASIVFLVLVVDENLPGSETLLAVTMITILFSILGHGLSANPLANRIGRSSEGDAS